MQYVHMHVAIWSWQQPWLPASEAGPSEGRPILPLSAHRAELTRISVGTLRDRRSFSDRSADVRSDASSTSTSTGAARLPIPSMLVDSACIYRKCMNTALRCLNETTRLPWEQQHKIVACVARSAATKHSCSSDRCPFQLHNSFITSTTLYSRTTSATKGSRS